MIDPNLIDRKNAEEHYVKRGDPTKPTYYIIRRTFDAEGLFFRYMVIAGRIRYALSNGYLPVVDMQNYPNPYLAPEKLGKENAWEYYFEQPLRIGVEQAYNGENVILSNGTPIVSPRPDWSMYFYENKRLNLTEWRMLVKFGLLKIKPAIYEEILAVREKLFSPNERVLGVLLRGTDYMSLKLINHPIPPPVEFAASVATVKLREWKCNKIFLATEDKEFIKFFRDTFGDVCVILDKEYIDFTPEPGKRLCVQHLDRENDYFLQGMEYLTQMVILSLCTSFIGARCSGSSGVMLMADNFENTYFFNLGRYKKISLR